MQVGDLITWFNPQLGGGYESFVGLIIDSDRKMIKVSFNGFKHPRWVSPTQCEEVA